MYPSMRIAEAVRFFSAIHARWDPGQLEADFAVAGLGASFEVRRMKRAYQRALVLALAAAAQPEILVIENAEEFDEPRVALLLERAIVRAPAALVTFGARKPDDAEVAPPDLSAFTEVLAAAAYAAGALA